MAKKKAKQPKASKALAPAAPRAPLAIQLTPIHLKAAIAFRDKAATIVISDTRSDEGALATILDGKKGKRQAAADWKVPIDKVTGVLTALRGLRDRELEAFEVGIDTLEKRHVAFKNADDARVAAEEAAARAIAEQAARKAREAELQEQEDAAAKLEAASDDLSARERKFVDTVAVMRGTELDGLDTAHFAAEQAGFKNAALKGPALLTSPKIARAIASAIEAKAIREQAEALRVEPLAVSAPKVESAVGKVSGARNTKDYSCGGVFNLEKFRAAYLAGEIPAEAMTPDLKFLNKMAESLKEKFEQAYPGCRLKIDQGVAG